MEEKKRKENSLTTVEPEMSFSIWTILSEWIKKAVCINEFILNWASC